MNPQGQSLVRAVQGPIILITVGVLFTIQHVAGIGLGKTWPVFLIVVGALKIFGGRRSSAAHDAPHAGSYAPPSYPTSYPAPPPPPAAPGERR